MNENTTDVIVVGAGLAGLAAAATAARAGRRVLVLDGRSPGGRARTDERGGFLFNQGAHALYAGGHAERVLGELGIAIPSGGKPSTDTYGRLGDLVSPLPFTPARVLRSRLVSTGGKAQLGRFVLALRGLDPAPLADRSAEAWLAGLRFHDDATDVIRLLSRVASYADDLDAISADAVAGQLKGAVSKGVRYLDRGWQVLVAALQATVEAAGGALRTGDPVVGVEPADGGVAVTLGDGTTHTAPAVVLATGGPAATASLLRDPPRWGLVGPPATAACLDLGLRRAPEHPVLFGVDQPLYLSTHTPAADLAPEGGFVVHLMRYGARDAGTDRADLWEHARVAGIHDEDVVEQRFLARMVTNHAVPVPGSGLAGRPSIEAAGLPGVYLAGEWVGPHGLLADAALASGQAAGQAAATRGAGPGGSTSVTTPATDDAFTAQRPRLLGLAYRMLGSLADAEDVVQDAWIRWAGTDQTVVEVPAAWLTTTTTRLALDRIRSLSRRREEYVGPWLPEPVAVAATAASSAVDPAAASELAESMTLGFLVVLDTLSATERAVFLLADVFGEPYAAIAAAVGKTEDNCRQIASRARRKVRAARKPETAPASSELLAQLLVATASGDVDGLLALLDTDVVLLSDGGGEQRAARRPVVGAERVARFMINLAKRLGPGSIEPGVLNGEQVVIFGLSEGPMVFGGDVVDGRFVSMQWQRNPSKLTHLDQPVELR